MIFYSFSFHFINIQNDLKHLYVIDIFHFGYQIVSVTIMKFCNTLPRNTCIGVINFLSSYLLIIEFVLYYCVELI